MTGDHEKHFAHVYVTIPEQHEHSGWHQEDLIAGNELQDVLLIGCQFV